MLQNSPARGASCRAVFLLMKKALAAQATLRMEGKKIGPVKIYAQNYLQAPAE